MRQALIDYIKGLTLGTFVVDLQLPWSESGTPLHLKNVKRIYVDRPQFEIESVLETLQGQPISAETTIVRVLFSTDAKQLPSNYDTLVNNLKLGKDIEVDEGFYKRICNITSEFENDLLVTELEYRFTKIT